MKRQILCNEIERMVGHQISTSKEFDELSELILKHTKVRLSPTTLKRIWGYLRNEEVEPRMLTLSTLARFVGYKSYDAFTKSADNNSEIQSGKALSRYITSDDIDVNDTLRLSWRPDRVLTIQHKGNGHFIVVEAVNTKLSVGDTFSCHLFIEHEPLFIDNLVHNGNTPVCYVIGRNDGITLLL